MIKTIITKIIKDLRIIPFHFIFNHYHCSRCLRPINFARDDSIFDKEQKIVCEDCIIKTGKETLTNRSK